MGNQDMMKDLLTEGMRIADDLYFNKGRLSEGRMPDKRDKIMDQIHTMIEAFAKRTTLKLDIARVVEGIDKNKTCAVFDIGKLMFVREEKKPQVFEDIDKALEFVAEKKINAMVLGVPEGYDFAKFEADLGTLRKALREEGDEDVAPEEGGEDIAPAGDDVPIGNDKPAADDKGEPPKKKEPADKEYFGRSGDKYFYLLRKRNDAGDVEDLVVADVDGNEVMSAKAMEKDPSDDIGFLIDAIKDADMDEISHDIYVAYIYPKLTELMMEPEGDEEPLAGEQPPAGQGKPTPNTPPAAVAPPTPIEGKVPNPTDTIPKQIADMLEEILPNIYANFKIAEDDTRLVTRVIKRSCETLKTSKEIQEEITKGISEALKADEGIEALDVAFEADGMGSVKLAYVGKPGVFKVEEGKLFSCFDIKAKKKKKKEK